MNKIIKENLNGFIEYYHEFHDSFITDVSYDIAKAKIELLYEIKE